MADEPTNPSANGADGELDEAKKWQRQSEKYRLQAREHQQNALETSQVKSQLAIMNKLVRDIASAVQSGDDEGVTAALSENETLQNRANTAASWQQQLTELLFENDVAWSDESLETVRKMWNEDGNYAGAYAEAQRILGSAANAGDIEEIVAQKVAAQLATLGIAVDTETSTAPAATRGATRETASRIARATLNDPKQAVADMEAELNKFFKV